MNLGHDFVWMAPSAALVLFLFPGLFFLLMGRLWKRIDSRTATIFVCCMLAFLNLLLFVPGLHHVAALVLAAGIATQVTRYIKKHRAAFVTLVRRTLPWMVGLVLVLGMGVRAWQMTSEKQALAASPAAPARAPR